MPVPIQALTTELTTDPTGLGYKTNGVFKSSSAIASLLTQPGAAVSNPVSQGQVPVTLTATGMMSLLSSASMANLRNFQGLTQLLMDIEGQNRTNVGITAAFLEASGDITSAEYTSIQSALTATQADPTWTSTVPGPCRLLTMPGANGDGHVAFADITSITGVA